MRACDHVFVRTCIHRAYLFVCIIRRFFGGIMLVKTNRPSVKAGYGPWDEKLRAPGWDEMLFETVNVAREVCARMDK